MQLPVPAVSVLEVPGGGEQTINNIYYYLAVFPDHIEVHLPTLRGYLNPYVEVLNFDAPRPKDYKASKTQSGWNISFNAADGEGMSTHSASTFSRLRARRS